MRGVPNATRNANVVPIRWPKGPRVARFRVLAPVLTLLVVTYVAYRIIGAVLYDATGTYTICKDGKIDVTQLPTESSFHAKPLHVKYTFTEIPHWQADCSAGFFNLSPLRLPAGLPWQYIASGRAFPWGHPEQKLLDARSDHAYEQSIILFGANATSEGNLEVVSKPTLLRIPSAHSDDCGADKYIYGSEDSRLFWTDDRRPMMTLTSMSGEMGRCRAMFMIRDVRAYWPELTEILAGNEIVPSLTSYHLESTATELEWKSEERRVTEKNWMPFSAGPSIQAGQAPHFLYGQKPLISLQPEAGITYKYKDKWGGQKYLQHYQAIGDNPSLAQKSCVEHKYPNAAILHNATPLYRLTFCKRDSCVPTMSNTVHVGISHIRTDATHYIKFVSVYSTEGGALRTLYVGPDLNLDTEDKTYTYVVSLVFEPRTRKNTVRSSEREYGLGHGFIDDDVLLGLGIGDYMMASAKMSAKQLLAGLTAC